MGFFTPRERRELNKPADVAEFTPSRRFRTQDFADNADSMQRNATSMQRNAESMQRNESIQRVARAPLQEIDELIADLHMRREQLLSESERVQREVIEYAKLSQSTLASTKIVTEALASWRTAPGGFGASEPRMRDDDVDDDVDGNAGPVAPNDTDAEAAPDNP